MYRFVILCFGLLVYIKQIRDCSTALSLVDKETRPMWQGYHELFRQNGDGNGITTVYKFRTLKPNTENVGLLDSFGLTSVSTHSENVKYLNTCSVSVHVENNPQRMPLFNIHGDSVLPNTTLPPLYSDQGLSTWQLILNYGTTRPLPAVHPFKIDLNNARDMAPRIINHAKAIMKDIMDTSDNDVVFEQRRVVRDEDLFKIIEKKPNTKTIVGVEFQASTEIMVIISWSGSTFKYKSLQVTVNNNRDIFVCYQDSVNSVYPETNDNLYSMCSVAPQKYTLDEKKLARLDIDITNNIIVIDKVSSITHETQLTIPSDCDTYTIRHEYDYSSSTGKEVLYTLKQQTPITIVSPWIDNMEYNPTMVILYSRPEGSNLSVCMESINTVQQTELVCEEQPQQNNIVLKQVNMTLGQDWIGRKRIKIIAGGGALLGNVWEGRHLDLYRVKEPQACVKSSIRDIYSIPHFEPHTIAQSDKVSHCFNGGRLENDFICSCPPGFVGHACQIPCGRNLFGQKCGKQCSRSPSACKGVVLCTPEYGCSCAPGYQGDYCSEQCQPGFYGADCKQPCGYCRDGCDIYTGHCHGGCHTTSLTRPQCTQSHSYLKSYGQVLDSSFDTINLQINFTPSNIVKSNDNTMFYMIQYRENGHSSWINGSYQLFNEGISDVSIQGLKPGRNYQFRTLLIDATLETHDPLLTKPTEGRTKCTIGYKGVLQTDNITNTSVSVSWDEENDLGQTECPAQGYILEIDENENGYVTNERIFITGKNSYTIENLSPNQTYQINLKKSTVDGESIPVYSSSVTTSGMIDLSKHIIGVTMVMNKSALNINWFPSPIYETFYIKYKLRRHLACEHEEPSSPLQVVTTNQTAYSLDLNDLDANSKYELFVTADLNQNINPQNMSFITLSKVPNALPTLLVDKLKVNHESVKLYWTDISLSCQHVNGYFKSYRIELYNKQSMSEHVYVTTDNRITVTSLSPNTQYVVRIRFVNHVGASSLYLEHTFTTKQASVLIQDLTAYKTGRDLIGLRWKSFDTKSTISGINIYLQDPIWNKTITLTEDLRAFQCKAWPDFVCFDVNELMSNRNYTIRVETLPEETQSNTIHAVTRETATSLPVSDIKAEYNNTSITVSWRIPHLLNGILRGFVLELEHLSSFDDKMCCQSLMNINYTVSSEQERYLYVLQNIMPASCYQISIRPFTKRLGPATNQIIDTPPLPMPFQTKPQIKLDNEAIQWKEENQTINPAENTELITETLIIVQEFNGDANVTQTVPDTFRSEMYRTLASNAWWLTHVCTVDDDPCSLNLSVHDYQNYTLPYYGQVVKKPLQVNHQYRIVAAQVNRYLSARSYTILATEYFTMK